MLSTDKAKFKVFEDERFVDLNLYQFGWERCEPAHLFGPYVRNHYLFHYIISGKGTYMVDDTYHQLHAGQGFLIVPGIVTTYMADKEEPWEYTWIEFDGLRVQESLIMAGIGGKSLIYTPASKKAGDELKDAMLRVVNSGEASPMQQIGYGYLFLDQFVQSSADRNQSGQIHRLRDFYMKESLSFIEQNYATDITVEDIANACGLNRSYFGKLFREAMGQSPQQFLITYRMAKGAQLLKETTLPVSQISSMVGYQDPLHFSRAFKKVYSLSPRNYRMEHNVIK